MMRNKISRNLVIGMAVLGISLASGCATKDTASYRFPELQEHIDVAKAADAEVYAPAPLQSAEDKLEAARLAVRTGDMVSANLLVDEAMVDADYAAAMAPTEKAEKEAMVMRRSIEDVREQIQQMPAVN